MDPLVQHRQWYSRLVAANAGVSAVHQRIIDAFATVPREQFLGPGPWKVFTRSGYIETPSDPALLYQDVLVALKSEAHLNNGQPSLHMACLATLGVQEGETVVHVGAGTGYYSAILATLTGQAGRVIGYEIDPDLAARAKEHLAGYSNVDVRHQSGTDGPLPECDVVYVNAGATAPLEAWTTALRPGGRLLFPLTPAQGTGYILMVTRTPPGAFAARFICGAIFTPCIGARDDETANKLSDAFSKGGIATVQSLRYHTPPDETCWFAGPDWWLSTAPL
ncbi:MAG TPA: methyltransferase domain-containing protein [Vicinamibacterales bacterium]|nr:methyltransferase domain-containing protein [Vicinamibacterales bacterium]